MKKNTIEEFSKEEFKYFQALINQKKIEEILSFINSNSLPDLQNLLSYLPRVSRVKFFLLIPEKISANIVESMPSSYELNYILTKITRKKAAAILNFLPSNLKIDLFKNIPLKISKNILRYFDLKTRKEILSIIPYKNNSAGGLMVTEYLEYPINFKVKDVRNDLEKNADKYSNYDIQYAYMVNKNKKLLGVINFRDILFTSSNQSLKKLLKTNIVSIKGNTKVDDLKNYFDEYHYLAFPVINDEEKLIGVLKRDSIKKFLQKETEQEILKLTGIIGGEEFRSMPLYKRSIKRLSWLSINILLNFMAASVIIVHQDTLAQVIALAVFLPIISDMSGCSGNQSIAVTLREMSLGLINIREIFRVLIKETFLGLINGVILGSMIAIIAIIWKGNIYLGLVVGITLFLNTTLAVCLGSALPIVLKFFKVDPAIASSPLLTSVTDMMGFFFIFLFANYFIQNLI